MKNKKGLELAVTTVIMIILSISILTLLVLFLNSQTGFLSRFFKAHSSESNVDLIISSCNSLALSESTYTYCCEKKEVSFGEKTPTQKLTCNEARLANWSSSRIQELSCASTPCPE